MALSRATSNSSDELGATIAGLKSRINELETATGVGGAPVGSIIDFIGASAPAGWTLLDGSTIVNGRFLYPSLWSVLPSNFKVGNNILKPDTRGRVTVHQGTSGDTSIAIGGSAGSPSVALTTNEMPSHDHGGATGNAYTTSTITVAGGAGTSYANNHVTGFSASPTNTIPSGSSNLPAGLHAHVVSSEGLGQAFSILQPFIVVLKIMKLA